MPRQVGRFSLLQTPNHMCLVQTPSRRGYHGHLCWSQWGTQQGHAAVGPREQGWGGEALWSLGAPGGRLPGGRRVGLGLGQSFAQLTSLVQNLLRGAGKGWWQGGVGAQGLGPFPGQNWHHSLAARPQRWVVCQGGGAADGGPIPSHQQNPGRNGAGEAGPAGLGRSGWRRMAGPGSPSLGAWLTRRSPTAS